MMSNDAAVAVMNPPFHASNFPPKYKRKRHAEVSDLYAYEEQMQALDDLHDERLAKLEKKVEAAVDSNRRRAKR